jgi:DNA polymerase-1
MNNYFWGLDVSWLSNLYYFASAAQDEPTGAIRLFLFNLCKILNKQKPSLLVAAIDSHLSFRKELDSSYKSTRKVKDEGLVQQINQIKEVIDALGIPSICVDRFEADDILATLGEEAKKIGIPFVSVISDKDYRQCLVTGKVGMYNKPKGADWRFFSQQMAEDDWGIKIGQCIDWQCLVGDQVDTIKGCESIGKKRATELLNQFGSIEGIYERIGEVPPKLRPKLEKFQERLATVQKLVTLVKNAGNFGNVLEHYAVTDFRVNRPELRKILQRNDVSNLETLILETFHG